MGKTRSRRDNNLRRHLAYIAARMMAEDGITDFATAKTKAARQAGLGEANLLPDNHEIEAALREYQGLYQKEKQPGQMRRLREVAGTRGAGIDAVPPPPPGSLLFRHPPHVSPP